jgi:hypothetical protein
MARSFSSQPNAFEARIPTRLFLISRAVPEESRGFFAGKIDALSGK